MKNKLYQLIEEQRQKMIAMADDIHDNPEYDGEEYEAAAMLSGYMEENGFALERGLGQWRSENRPSVRV